MIDVAGFIVTADNGRERYFFWPDDEKQALIKQKDLIENGWTDVEIKPVCLCEHV